MKLIALALLTLSTSAYALTVEELFNYRSTCYARTYSPQHMASHPRQTVSSIRAIFRYEGQSPILNLTVNSDGRALRSKILCHNYRGIVKCPVECDGGSVDITSIDRYGSITLRNNNVRLSSGCGEEDGVELVAEPGGDDVFVMPFCR